MIFARECLVTMRKDITSLLFQTVAFPLLSQSWTCLQNDDVKCAWAVLFIFISSCNHWPASWKADDSNYLEGFCFIPRFQYRPLAWSWSNSLDWFQGKIYRKPWFWLFVFYHWISGDFLEKTSLTPIQWQVESSSTVQGMPKICVPGRTPKASSSRCKGGML